MAVAKNLFPDWTSIAGPIFFVVAQILQISCFLTDGYWFNIKPHQERNDQECDNDLKKEDEVGFFCSLSPLHTGCFIDSYVIGVLVVPNCQQNASNQFALF